MACTRVAIRGTVLENRTVSIISSNFKFKAMRFLFWNLNKKILDEHIKNLAIKEEIDIFIFAEFISQKNILLDLLNSINNDYFLASNTNCEKIVIFTKFPGRFVTPIFESGRMTIREINLPGKDPILLAATHFISKSNYSDESQNYECGRCIQDIEAAEKLVKHSRTILVGDLNMNPFQPGVVAAGGLNAVMCRKIAMNKTRTVQEKEYTFLYNPMWNIFGDNSSFPQGTYYYHSSEHVNYYWNIFDQVLIRPDMIQLFDTNSLKVIDSDGEDSFLTEEGIPDASRFSDHLPILFNIKI